MRTLFRIVNVFLIVAMIGCCAGALAGMIVFLPFVAGAWVLNLMGLLGFEEAARAPRRERSLTASPEPAPLASPEPHDLHQAA